MTLPEARLYSLGGEGPDLVLLHGFGGDRYGWAANAPQLFGAARVWALDLPGHGEAPDAVGDGSAATLAKAVSTALPPLSGPALVVGHSLGGAVAVELARLVPERVRGLVLIAPAGFGGGAVDRGFLAGYPGLTDPEAARALLERLVERKRLISAGMVQHVLASLAREDRREALRRVAEALAGLGPLTAPPGLPMHLVWGLADRINPPPAPLPEGALALENTGHMPHVEAAGKVNALIREALADARG